MLKVADIRDGAVATEIHAVQQAAYAVEARWIGCRDFPPLRETIAEFQHSRDRFLVFEWEGRIVGALAYERGVDCVTINRLVVSPDHFRRGIASALLATLEDRLTVGTLLRASTAELNQAAIKTYEKHGVIS